MPCIRVPRVSQRRLLARGELGADRQCGGKDKPEGEAARRHASEGCDGSFGKRACSAGDHIADDRERPLLA